MKYSVRWMNGKYFIKNINIREFKRQYVVVKFIVKTRNKVNML